jgi:Pvc16 N-terminal domain
MIFEALELIRAELQAYIRPFSTTAKVELGSITNVAGSQSDKILVSLINVEEENALKNISPYQRNPTGGFDVKNPPIFLNLYVLIAANFTDNPTYETALKLLARIIQCFQAKRTYTVANTPRDIEFADPQASTLHVTMDLYSMSFEKINQLWGTLGGKQVPFVCYKMRVVEEQADKQVGGGSAIMTIETNGQLINTALGN